VAERLSKYIRDRQPSSQLLNSAAVLPGTNGGGRYDDPPSRGWKTWGKAVAAQVSRGTANTWHGL